ncbi:hypothetical protein PV797_08030 [Clostridiaceae bacterium M8S5]|nr:hypothetical protein PV797_08030 [Clostridiaceae bacterium M8S5]
MIKIGNFKDFDLDIKKVSNKGVEVNEATLGVICTYIITKVVDSLFQSCTGCSNVCPPPNESQDQCLP